jgi:hypothetical protein
MQRMVDVENDRCREWSMQRMVDAENGRYRDWYTYKWEQALVYSA